MEPALIRGAQRVDDPVEEIPITKTKEKFSFKKMKNRIVSRIRFQYMQLKWRLRNEQTSPDEWGMREIHPTLVSEAPNLPSEPIEQVPETSHGVKDIDFEEEVDEPAPAKKWVDEIDVSQFVDWEEKHKGAPVEVTITRSAPGATPPLGVNLPHFTGDEIYFLFFALKIIDDDTQELHRFRCLVPIDENADFLADMITSEDQTPPGFFPRHKRSTSLLAEDS